MLYKIAVCDDDKIDLQETCTNLFRFSMEFNLEFDIDRFSSGNSLLKEYEKCQKPYDIIFLEIKISDFNGIDLAKAIRRMPDRNVLLVFITNFPEYMQDSFDVQASQYLIKPLSYAIFSEKLHKLIAYLNDLQTNIKVISMKSGDIILYLETVIYFETSKNPTMKSLLSVTTTTEKIQIKAKINHLENELKDKFFIRIHRSILANMRYIKKFNSQTLEFTTGEKVAISRRKIAEVKKAFPNDRVMKYER